MKLSRADHMPQVHLGTENKKDQILEGPKEMPMKSEKSIMSPQEDVISSCLP